MTKKSSWIVKLICFILVCVVVYCGYNLIIQVRVFGGSSAEYNTPIEIGEDDNAGEVAKKCQQACVAVYYEKDGKKTLSASGVAIKANGYIATNYHVIKKVATGTSGETLSVMDYKGDFYPATLLWYDIMCDVAIIKTNTNANISYLEMKDRWINCLQTEKLNLLEKVIAIGTPLKDIYYNSVTVGYVASTEYRISYSESRFYENLIQHSCALKKGNSGGALVDLNGNLIGLNTLADNLITGSYFEDGIYMSVPIYPVMLALDQVVYNYEHNITRLTKADLPIGYYDKTYNYFSASTYEYDGDFVYVSSVPASITNISRGDEICKIVVGGINYNVCSRNDLTFALLHAKPGDSVSVYFRRSGVQLASPVTLVLE